MSSSSVENAIMRRKELQERIRVALEEIAEIEQFLKMNRRWSIANPTAPGPGQAVDKNQAGSGTSQAVFESFIVSVLRDIGRPLQSGEVVEEFRKRGHPIGGLNETKMAWNRLWEAKTRNVLVNLPPHGYWLADEPLPENVEIPEGPRKRLRNDRRYIKGGERGRKPIMTEAMLAKAREMMDAKESVSKIARTLGLSTAAIYSYFPGGHRGFNEKNDKPADDESSSS